MALDNCGPEPHVSSFWILHVGIACNTLDREFAHCKFPGDSTNIKEAQTYIHAQSGIWIHNVSVRMVESKLHGYFEW